MLIRLFQEERTSLRKCLPALEQPRTLNEALLDGEREWLRRSSSVTNGGEPAKDHFFEYVDRAVVNELLGRAHEVRHGLKWCEGASEAHAHAHAESGCTDLYTRNSCYVYVTVDEAAENKAR